MRITETRRVSFADPRMHWLNEPPSWQAEGETLAIVTGARTDFWQGTHYGFRRDDGHVFGLEIEGDFRIETSVAFVGHEQYDQCGLMVRADANAWIKCSAEYESPSLSRVGSVVTRRGFSDWATQDIETALTRMRYRISRCDADFLIEAAIEGQPWKQLRICHLDDCPSTLFVGPYACSPIGEAFRCRFEFLELGPTVWSQPA